MPAPQFNVNTQLYDPYKNYKFLIRWDNKVVAGVSKVSGLTRTTQVVTHREDGDPTQVHRSPGQTEFGPITLERGVTHDKDFEEWANKVWNRSNAVGNEISLQDFRKDITIELMNEAGQKVIAYNIFRCWVSSYTALPDMDASGNAVAIQSLTLQNEGWERDTSVAEPSEAKF